MGVADEGEAPPIWASVERVELGVAEGSIDRTTRTHITHCDTHTHICTTVYVHPYLICTLYACKSHYVRWTLVNNYYSNYTHHFSYTIMVNRETSYYINGMYIYQLILQAFSIKDAYILHT